MGFTAGGLFGGGGKSNSGNSTTTSETYSTNQNVGGGGGDVSGNLDLSSINNVTGGVTVNKSDMGAVSASFDFARDFSSNIIKSSSGNVDAAIAMASEKSRGEIENVLVSMQKYAFFAIAGYIGLQVFKTFKGAK